MAFIPILMAGKGLPDGRIPVKTRSEDVRSDESKGWSPGEVKGDDF